MSEDVVRSALRASKDHGKEPRTGLLIIQICAWAKLSKESKIPKASSFDQVVKATSPHDYMVVCFNKFMNDEDLYLSKAFTLYDLVVKKSTESEIEDIISIIWSAADAGKIDYSVIVEFAHSLTVDRSGFHIRPDLAKLAVELSEANDSSTVYCPFDSSYSIASAAADIADKVYTEAAQVSQIPFLINLLEDKNIRSAFSDPIQTPSWKEEGGHELKQFDVSIAFPPLGRRIDPKSLDDWYGRFAYRSAFGEVYAIQHTLAHTRHKAVVCVSNGILFRSAQTELNYRRYLIERGMLETVISLPKDIFQPSASIACSLLVLNHYGDAKDVLFIDASHMLKQQIISDFTLSAPFAKTVFEHQKVMELVSNRTDTDLSSVTTYEELAENDFNLVADRYIISDQQRDTIAKLKEHELTNLEEIATLIRPQALRKLKDAKGEMFLEVWPSDAPDAGYLPPPKRQIVLSENQLSRARRQEIRASDILLSTKGTVGSVALASPDFEGHWLPSQSQLIIRLGRNNKLDPRALYMYLRSDVFQALLKGLATGATVQMVQMSDLKKLPIPVMSDDLQSQLVEAFEDQASAIEKIKSLENKVSEINKRHWGLPSETTINE